MNDEELRQAMEAVKEQQPVTVDLEWYQGTIKLTDVKQFIRANINSASRSFVAIGYYLKYIRDRQLFKDEGYSGILEFAKAEFGISAGQASKFMSINDRFSKDGNSPILLEQYKDFSSSKLSEMLYLTDEQLGQVSIATTVAEIRDIKEPEKDKSFSISKTEPECFIRDQINETKEDGLKCSGGISDKCTVCDKAELIDDLDFTVRTYNCLKRADIATIDQLCGLTEEDVIKIRNISRKCLDEIKLKLSEIGKELKYDKPIGEDGCTGECFWCADEECNSYIKVREDCLFDANIKCSIYGAHQTAITVCGVDCKSSCCMNCEEDCGARCNHSAHETTKQSKTVKMCQQDASLPCTDCNPYCHAPIPEHDNESDAYLPCDTCGWETKNCCGYENTTEDYCFNGDKWKPIEPEQVETVEADIIQTEHESPDYCGRESGINEIIRIKPTRNDDDVNCPAGMSPTKPGCEWFIKRDGITFSESCAICNNCWESYIWKLINADRDKIEPVDTEKSKPVQPELPILKNNDQRKDFIDAYETWPIWIDLKETGERYYRYDLTDKVAIVVKVNLRHVYKGYSETKEIEYTSPQYYLLGIKTQYSTKVTYHEDPTRTFAECSSNMTDMVNYLKEFQKKGA